MTTEDVGAKIKAQREQAEISQVDLARSAGCSIIHLWRIEKGHRNPSPDLLSSIAKALNVSVEELAAAA